MASTSACFEGPGPPKHHVSLSFRFYASDIAQFCWFRMRILVMPLWQQAIAFNDAGICGPEGQFLGPSQSWQEMEMHGLAPLTSSSRPPCGFIRNLLKTSSRRKRTWWLKPLSCKLRKVKSRESTRLHEMALSLYAGAMSTADFDPKRFGTESTCDRHERWISGPASPARSRCCASRRR